MEWIRSPAKLLLAIAILAVSARILYPGILISLESGTIDQDLADRDARLLPIQGKVVSVTTHEDTGTHIHQIYLDSEVVYEAQVPGHATPLRPMTLGGRTQIAHHGELPPDLPKVGDPVTLWYDPESTYISTIKLDGEPITSLWLGLILVGLGVLGLVIAGVLVRLAIRRPTPGSA
jgi:hypothetical protein